MKFDRQYQFEILTKLADTAPTHLDCIEWLQEAYEMDPEKYAANMRYLEQEGLVESYVRLGVDRKISVAFPPELTSDGVNFVMGDGGIRAILDTVTIKFHGDTLNQLLTAIAQSHLPQSDKKKFSDALKQLPAEAITHLTKKLVEMGLQNMHLLPQLIQTLAQSG